MSSLLITFWPLVLAVLFTCHAFGGLIAVLSAKFGKTLGMILYVLTIIGACVLGGFFISRFIVRDSVSVGFSFDISAGIMGLGLLVALVLDILFFLLLYMVVRNKNLEI